MKNKSDLFIENLYRELVSEKKKKEKPGKTDYYINNKTNKTKSNKEMEREINKCAKEPRPKSCYDYWEADKEYDKKHKKKKKSLREEISSLIKEEMIEEKKKKQKSLSAKTKETLKKKAEDANMPLSALTGVYRKGLAAWLTGHRQGTPQHAWAMGRVNSFIKGGKARSVDKAEWKKVQDHRKKK